MFILLHLLYLHCHQLSPSHVSTHNSKNSSDLQPLTVRFKDAKGAPNILSLSSKCENVERQKRVHSPAKTSACSFCVLALCDVPIFFFFFYSYILLIFQRWLQYVHVLSSGWGMNLRFCFIFWAEARKAHSRKLEWRGKRTVSAGVGSVHLRSVFLSVCPGHSGRGPRRTHRARSAVHCGPVRNETRTAPTQGTKWQ